MRTQRIASLKSGIISCILGLILSFSANAQSDGADSPQAIEAAFRDAVQLSKSKQYFAAAEKFFNIYTLNGKYSTQSLGQVTENLMKQGMPNAAAYFYIKTLQAGDRNSIKRILTYLPAMMDHVGGDLLRVYIVRHTTESDYDNATKSHFYYFLGKDELLRGDAQKALNALSRVGSASGIMAHAIYLKGVAYSMVGQTESALSAFQSCKSVADKSSSRFRSMKKETEDLSARCAASQARVYYQMGQFDKAEELYDEISKASFVWTDILFEQAWSAYAKEDYNRALGKLVSYRSPSLEFVFNPEVEVLRAQSFLSLCHYEDVGRTVEDFNAKYAQVGTQMKNLLLSNQDNLGTFYNVAKRAYYKKLHSKDMMDRALNRFVRGPHFASYLLQDRAITKERSYLGRFRSHSFSGFVDKVLAWREKSLHLLAGAFVKNTLYDMYQDLIAQLDKMSFIKLEMLKHSKTSLEARRGGNGDEDSRVKGATDIERKDYQYFWTFNGEFWIDELGDYVFSLESRCSNGS